MRVDPAGHTGLGLALSVAFHMGVAVTLLTSFARSGARPLPSVVRFEIAPPPPPPPPPPQKPLEPRTPRGPKPSALTPRPPAPTTATTSTPPKSRAPLDSSGVLLDGDGQGAGFAIDARPVGAPIATPHVTVPRPVARPLKPTPDPVVAASDLSRQPTPPALDGALRNHYPDALRGRGISGEAVVRARIDADGRVRSCSMVSESEPGFGAACRGTLLGSHWSAPLDRQGRSVATYVRYTCHFRVER